MQGTLVVAGTALAAIGFGAAATQISADGNGNPNAEACAGQVIATLVRGGAGGEGAGKVTLQDFHLAFIRQACAAGESVAAIVQKVREGSEAQ